MPLENSISASQKKFLQEKAEQNKPILNGFILQNYWDLLHVEFKPKGNKLLSVIELWTQSKQGSRTLNKWLTYVYNLVELSDYGNSKDRIIRDVLIIGSNSDKAKDKIEFTEINFTMQKIFFF